MHLAERTLTAINKALEKQQELGFRTHLGASVIGRPCAREVWYIWRWATNVQHRGQLLRLFDRGHREEERFTKWLADAGITVYAVDAEGKQYRVSDFDGHFGGSLDSVLVGIPDLPVLQTACLGEFKTHNDKSYDKVVESGVRVAKPEHYVQMQIYMHYYRLSWALYLAINKNNDHIHAEIVEYHEATAVRYTQRAQMIVWAKEPPKRINESPAWYQCKFCDHRPVCHGATAPAVNCRTCLHGEPHQNAQWLCHLHGHCLDKEAQLAACSDYARRF